MVHPLLIPAPSIARRVRRRISLRVFDHVMDLDLTFHLRKKTGEVTKVVDRGTNAMQNILSTILFNVLPQVRAGPAPSGEESGKAGEGGKAEGQGIALVPSRTGAV